MKPTLVVFLTSNPHSKAGPNEEPLLRGQAATIFNNWLTILRLPCPHIWVAYTSLKKGKVGISDYNPALYPLLDALKASYSLLFVALGTYPSTYLKSHAISHFKLPSPLYKYRLPKYASSVRVELEACSIWLNQKKD